MAQLSNTDRSYLQRIYQQLDIEKKVDKKIEWGRVKETEVVVYAGASSLQYVGFAVMYKDLIEYLAARAIAGPAVTTLRNAYNTALNVDYLYLAEFHPKGYANLSATDLPNGLTEHVAAGNSDLPELRDDGLALKLSPFFGWAFFREYSKDLKGPITASYGEAGLPGVFDDRETGAVDLAEKLLSKTIPNEYYWYPVVLYVCILLYKTDFKTVS